MKLRHFCGMVIMLAQLCVAPLVQAAPFTFTFSTLPAAGAISGSPGTQVGWGYQLVNTDSSNWFVPTQLSVSSFSIGLPDASLFDFPMLAPGATVSQAFDLLAHTGLYAIEILPFVLPSMSDSGNFTLQGAWWSGDPLAGGTFLQLSDAVLTPYSLEVAGVAAIPLPGSLPLLTAALLVWGVQRRVQKFLQRGSRTG
jgi:hypothetical protein